MASNRGIIVLMGSGELTATMVEVHKRLLCLVGKEPRAVFLDTPAGFQPNVEQISGRAVEYFRTRVQCPMEVASFKSRGDTSPFEAEQAFRALRRADYILIGPGSPTYAVRQWSGSPIPEILITRIDQGGCLVAASAAALTVGQFTLPVYEIYKVGEAVYWVEGMDIFSHFGLSNLVVIPHWNNAEGGTHDTRFCFMGESRFRKLEDLLPPNIAILGLDEHTACVIDFAAEEGHIEGIGCVTLRRNDVQTVFKRGDRFSVDVLRGKEDTKGLQRVVSASRPPTVIEKGKRESFWDAVHAIQEAFHRGLTVGDAKQAASALLDLDRIIWKGYQDLESEEFISQAREVLREQLVVLANRLEDSTRDNTETLPSLVRGLLKLRARFRRKEQWQEADAIRACLEQAHIVVEDTEEGPRWRLLTPEKP